MPLPLYGGSSSKLFYVYSLNRKRATLRWRWVQILTLLTFRCGWRCTRNRFNRWFPCIPTHRRCRICVADFVYFFWRGRGRCDAETSLSLVGWEGRAGLDFRSSSWEWPIICFFGRWAWCKPRILRLANFRVINWHRRCFFRWMKKHIHSPLCPFRLFF